MPEIKIKHVVSFSSEDKVHKADNLVKPETYRKWKCATPGEKNATIILQFEKATQIHSIDIGNESSAFVEVLVGRSSDTVNDYQVLLVASSFMSPLESRNGTHTNRVRMFGPEKLSQNTKDEKWDCVQVICTQPFNKTITYGLTFIKFHSPPGKIDELSRNSEAEKPTAKLGAFKLKVDTDDEEDSLPSIGSFFGKEKSQVSESFSGSTLNKTTPSYAAAVLASSSNAMKLSPQGNTQKRKISENSNASQEPPAKKTPATVVNKEHIVYKDVLRDAPENKRLFDTNGSLKKNTSSPKTVDNKKTPKTMPLNKPSSSNKPEMPKQKAQYDKIMDRVVFVLSGFVNPLRSELRDKALEMGAKYKADWDSSCTHLVCAFMHTPKYVQVKKLNGRIVSKEWILDCYKKKSQLSWRNYVLGKLKDRSEESDSSEEESDISEEEFEDSEDEYVPEKKKKKKKKTPQTILQRKKDKTRDSPDKKNQPSTPSNTSTSDTPSSKNSSTPSSKDQLNTPRRKDASSIFDKIKESSTSSQGNVSDNSRSPTLLASREGSETEDEEALQDYVADTDVDDESGGDTEDEIRKVEMEELKRKAKSRKMNGLKENSESLKKPDVTNLPLPELPNLFKQRHFFLFGEFSSSKLRDMQRYIIAYNGVIEDYMSDKIKYVITDEKWDGNFEDALGANEDLIFVKPTWIYKCHEAGKLLPYQPYIVIPDT